MKKQIIFILVLLLTTTVDSIGQNQSSVVEKERVEQKDFRTQAALFHKKLIEQRHPQILDARSQEEFNLQMGAEMAHVAVVEIVGILERRSAAVGGQRFSPSLSILYKRGVLQKSPIYSQNVDLQRSMFCHQVFQLGLEQDIQ